MSEQREAMELTINGTTYTVADSPTRPLLWVLRDELGLTGTKVGCAAGFCGACTVHVDGEAQRSCGVMVDTLAGAEIRTIEGMAEQQGDGSLRLHPVQQAFLEAQVPQCGWCMSGQMMTAAAFLARNPRPSEEEVVEAMGKNYCRCGCYVRIKTAVLDAAERLGATDAEEAV
ncbi:MAG TPA: (2Fe-2S)-binding protein [Roseiflexaceae bacterium]|nr:(2Fe-2S)-binding protein [Roseiflexaceae bacterium]